MAREQVVYEANERCEQGNLIEQLKNGVNVLRMEFKRFLNAIRSTPPDKTDR
jgi:hypothetical protein